jgi:hypothetical protein
MQLIVNSRRYTLVSVELKGRRMVVTGEDNVKRKIALRRGQWQWVSKYIEYNEGFIRKIKGDIPRKHMTPEQQDAIFRGGTYPVAAYAGITRWVNRFSPITVYFE